MSLKDDLVNTFFKIHNALISNDTGQIAELFAEDYRGFNLSGGVDTRELILQMFSPGQVQLDGFEIEEMKVDCYDEVGMITGLGRVKGRYQQDKFEHYIRFIDIFKYYDSTWRYYFSQATEIIEN